jgi:hypothetical protein
MNFWMGKGRDLPTSKYNLTPLPGPFPVMVEKCPDLEATELNFQSPTAKMAPEFIKKYWRTIQREP